MNWILKNKNKRAKALFVVLFLVFAFSLSYSIAKADPQIASNSAPVTSTVPTNDACHIQILDPSTWLQCALIGVLQAVGYLFAIAATLFAWVIDASNISGPTGVLEKQAILDVWYMVRDLLNMTFILILLFAAFCTIFQVDKWNLKKVWLNILINALLVNFSYPIARFVIDISNVAFYYFVKNLFTSTTTAVTGSSIFSMFSATSGIGDILAPQSYVSYANAYLIIMIIFVFTFGMTLLIVAALFVVRLVALAMLIMFSPIGFVGYIFPSTGKYADKWWSNLFSYSFFAPIMIFVMAISLRIAQQIKDANMSAMYIQGGVNAGNDQAKFIANAAFYFIPLIILWAGMGVAKSFSIEGAAMVTGKVKGWGNWVGKQAWSGAKWTAYGNPIGRGIKEGVKEKSKYNAAVKWLKSDSRLEAAVKGGIVQSGKVFGNKGTATGWSEGWNKVSDKDVNERIKEYKDKNMTIDAIAKDLDPSKSRTDRMAAAKHLMGQKGALNDPGRLENALKIVGPNTELRKKIIDSAADFAGDNNLNADSMNKIMLASTEGLEANSQEAKDITGKIKGSVKKENIKKLIEYEQKYAKNNRTEEEIYTENMKSLNAESFGKQKDLHENIDKDTQLQNYVEKHVKTDVQYHQDAFKHMKKSAREAWIKKDFEPKSKP